MQTQNGNSLLLEELQQQINEALDNFFTVQETLPCKQCVEINYLCQSLKYIDLIYKFNIF
jgi:uridine kinase